MNRQALKARIMEMGMTQQDVAEKLEIAPQTFYRKMRRGIFGTDEVIAMVRLLKIEDPMAIFFDELVTHKVTNGDGEIA